MRFPFPKRERVSVPTGSRGHGFRLMILMTSTKSVERVSVPKMGTQTGTPGVTFGVFFFLHQEVAAELLARLHSDRLDRGIEGPGRAFWRAG